MAHLIGSLGGAVAALIFTVWAAPDRKIAKRVAFWPAAIILTFILFIFRTAP